jgi:hypothetical protein
LNLVLSGVSEEQGRRLARLLADDLGAVRPPSHCGDLDNLTVTITSPPGASMQTLSKAVIADLLRQLDRQG